jgi:hypothetical protein
MCLCSRRDRQTINRKKNNMFYTNTPSEELIQIAKAKPNGRLLDIVQGMKWIELLENSAVGYGDSMGRPMIKESIGRFHDEENGEFYEAILLREEEDPENEFWAFYCLP